MSSLRLDQVLIRLLRSVCCHPEVDGRGMTRIAGAVDVLSQLPLPEKDCRVSIRISEEIQTTGCNGTILYVINIGRGHIVCSESGFYTIAEECRSESEKEMLGDFSYSSSFSSRDAERVLCWAERLNELLLKGKCRVVVR